MEVREFNKFNICTVQVFLSRNALAIVHYCVIYYIRNILTERVVLLPISTKCSYIVILIKSYYLITETTGTSVI